MESHVECLSTSPPSVLFSLQECIVARLEPDTFLIGREFWRLLIQELYSLPAGPAAKTSTGDTS